MVVIIGRSGASGTPILRWVIGLMVIFALGAVLWYWPAWRAAAQVGAAYGARIGCACRYVEGRSADSCARDTGAESGMALVSISDDPEEKAVSGHVWLMAKRTARLKPRFGCVLDPM